MDDAPLLAAAGEDAYLVGGVIRDQLLGRAVLDVDVACADPEAAARAYAGAQGGAVVPLSERHGAWRVAYRDGHTVDFTPLRGTIADDLATRDFTVNAIARRLGTTDAIDPLGGVEDLGAKTLRAVTEGVFRADPLRLLRAVRLEDELGFRMDEETEALARRDAALVTEPAGERVLGELERLSPDGFRRLDELGLLGPLGGDSKRLDDVDPAEHPSYALVVVLGDAVRGLPASNETKRFAATLLRAEPPVDDSPRAIYRFRRATEPWALETLAYLRAGSFVDSVLAARAADPAEPLLRGDELGIPAGPEIGRLLGLVEEERAAGTITTRDEALELVRQAKNST